MLANSCTQSSLYILVIQVFLIACCWNQQNTRCNLTKQGLIQHAPRCDSLTFFLCNFTWHVQRHLIIPLQPLHQHACNSEQVATGQERVKMLSPELSSTQTKPMHKKGPKEQKVRFYCKRQYFPSTDFIVFKVIKTTAVTWITPKAKLYDEKHKWHCSIKICLSALHPNTTQIACLKPVKLRK